MLALLSPAKKLDFETPSPLEAHSQPAMLDQAQMLARSAKRLKPADLKRMMGISDALADLNVQRFKDFAPPFDLGNAKQAILAFRGDVYVGFDADSLDGDDLAFAQDHLRILSGLYGLLRPLDLMQAYRLEMGTKFKSRRGEDLYAFWGDRLAKALNREEGKQGVVINLASNEYVSAVPRAKLKAQVITCNFYEMRDGAPRMISFFAKKARGLMARYMVTNRITEPEGLQGFDLEGYGFRADLSKPDKWAFTRPDTRPA